jgi:hypothetical protein
MQEKVHWANVRSANACSPSRNAGVRLLPIKLVFGHTDASAVRRRRVATGWVPALVAEDTIGKHHDLVVTDVDVRVPARGSDTDRELWRAAPRAAPGLFARAGLTVPPKRPIIPSA